MDKEEARILNVEYWLSGLAKDNWRDFYKDEDVQTIARISLEIVKLLHEKQNALALLKDPDRIKVTRCKDCKHATMTTDGRVCKYCELITDDDGCEKRVNYDANWYCADGKRR